MMNEESQQNCPIGRLFARLPFEYYPPREGETGEGVMTAIVPKMTDSGFLFGPARVSASASDNGGNVWVGVASKRASISVHVTPSGQLRVWKDGKKVFPAQ